MLIPAFTLLIAFFSESMRRDKTGCKKDNCGMIHIRTMRDAWQKKPLYYCTNKWELANDCIMQYISACCHLMAISLHHHKIYTPWKLL